MDEYTSCIIILLPDQLGSHLAACCLGKADEERRVGLAGPC